MADIRAFKGFVYDSNAVDIKKVVAPPYDVINEEEQRRLYDVDEHNVVRLVLGRVFEDDKGSDDRYTRASEYLNSWMQKRIIRKHEEDSVYLYEQEFTLADGTGMNRSGFIALAGVAAETGVVMLLYLTR